MPSTPLVTFKSTQPDKHLQKAMFIESVGQGISQIAGSVGAAVDTYQKTKQNNMMRDMAKINVAGELVGGVDKLPVETKDKIPGIMGVEMPRDEAGHVVITEQLKDLMNRGTKEWINSDPQSAIPILAGGQEKAPHPINVKLQQQKIDADLTGDVLRAETASQDRAAKAFQDTQNHLAKLQEISLQNEGALARAGMTEKQRQEYLNQPAEYAIDNTTGEPITHLSATTALGPNEDYNKRFTTLTRGGMRDYLKAMEVKAKTANTSLQTQLAGTRLELAKNKLKASVTPDNFKEFKMHLDILRKAQIAGDSRAESAAQKDLDNFFLKTGFSDDPSMYEQIKDFAKTYASGMGEWMFGTGVEQNFQTTQQHMGTSLAATLGTPPAQAQQPAGPRQSVTPGAVPGRTGAKPQTPIVDRRPGVSTTTGEGKTPYTTTAADIKTLNSPIPE